MQNALYTAVFIGLLTATSASITHSSSKIVGCNPPQGRTASVNTKPDSSINGQWYLVPILASDTATGRYPTITFNTAKNTFTGNTGCNRMSGTFKSTDTSLVFDERIMLTKMLCTGYNEAAFVKNLLSANTYQRNDSMLILMFNQTELSRWTRKPYRAPVGKRT